MKYLLIFIDILIHDSIKFSEERLNNIDNIRHSNDPLLLQVLKAWKHKALGALGFLSLVELS